MASEIWYIYGLIQRGSLVYVGLSSNPHQRSYAHKFQRDDGDRPEMFIFETHQDKAAAMEREKVIINTLAPSGNDHFVDRGAVKLVKYQRKTDAGRLVDITIRVKKGMMMPDEAKEVWFSDSRASAPDLIRKMPGWNRTKAEYIFGKRD